MLISAAGGNWEGFETQILFLPIRSERLHTPSGGCWNCANILVVLLHGLFIGLEVKLPFILAVQLFII